MPTSAHPVDGGVWEESKRGRSLADGGRVRKWVSTQVSLHHSSFKAMHGSDSGPLWNSLEQFYPEAHSYDVVPGMEHTCRPISVSGHIRSFTDSFICSPPAGLHPSPRYCSAKTGKAPALPWRRLLLQKALGLLACCLPCLVCTFDHLETGAVSFLLCISHSI